MQKSNWKCKVSDEKVSKEEEEEAFLNSKLQQQL